MEVDQQNSPKVVLQKNLPVKGVGSDRGISTGSSSPMEEAKNQSGPGQQMNAHIPSIPKVPVREPKSNSHA